MIKSLLITVLVGIQSICYGQNLFLIGEKSYPCTETFVLDSNMGFLNEGLSVLIAKDGNKGMIVVSKKVTSTNDRIKGKLIIYLDDGTVISCIDGNKNDMVDNITSSVYFLTNEELNKMKSSNIYSIRYSIKCVDCVFSTSDGDYSVSNKDSDSGDLITKKRTDVPSLIRELFD
ncbi:MAG: hypothetical protein HRU50_00040 [Winogradskyella sp.]|uniref:hypothetical protein n=1 Tax=Winogradskyella sp. TaxID=1883156 RepID=UPI0025F834B9|nr:hypothetical protein [Winogradskyella sp.]NRB58310.1 hypothetical protein [Winogradskyella sp.]